MVKATSFAGALSGGLPVLVVGGGDARDVNNATAAMEAKLDQLVLLATVAAQSAYPTLTRERAFAKLYESEQVLREAVQVVQRA